jgi:murein DD-endopeptidase MepM/ murein hydrolase activator NlpD
MKSYILRLANRLPRFKANKIQTSDLKRLFNPDNIVKITAVLAMLTAAFFITEVSGLTSFLYKIQNEKPIFKPIMAFKPGKMYGFDRKVFSAEERQIKFGDTFFSLLVKHGLTTRQTDSLLRVLKKSGFNFGKIETGNPYTVLNKKTEQHYHFLIYEPSVKQYVIFNLKTPSVKTVKRKVTVKEYATTGTFDKTFWSTLKQHGMSTTLTSRVQNAIKHKLDFKKFDTCDTYKLIWEQQTVDGNPVGHKKLKGLIIKEHEKKEPVYAFKFNNKDWLEKEAMPLRDSFLEAPLRKVNITSHYNTNRLHPVLGYHRPHFGTDYAAPYGTPIYSVADGIIKEARYSKSNGKFVKIEHKKPFASQYLHMCRFATGIRKGKSVKKGQIIGYVGATGLATGPHVCFRFWKQGEQVNHLKEKFFSSTEGNKFKKFTEKIISRLDKIPLLNKDDDDKKSKNESSHASKGFSNEKSVR